MATDIDTTRVGTYSRRAMLVAMHGLIGKPVDDVVRVIIEPLYGGLSKVITLSRVIDEGKIRFDQDGQLVLQEETHEFDSQLLQDALNGAGIEPSRYYSIDAKCVYTENGTYDVKEDL